MAHLLNGATTSLVKPLPDVPGRKEPGAFSLRRGRSWERAPRDPLSLGDSMTSTPVFPEPSRLEHCKLPIPGQTGTVGAPNVLPFPVLLKTCYAYGSPGGLVKMQILSR